MMIEIDKVNPDCILTTESIAAQVITISIQATLDDNTGIDTAITGAAHNDLAPPIEDTAINLAMTHHIDHITDHPHIEDLQVIDLEIIGGHIHNHPTDLQGLTHVGQVHNSAGKEENHIPRRT